MNKSSSENKFKKTAQSKRRLNSRDITQKNMYAHFRRFLIYLQVNSAVAWFSQRNSIHCSPEDIIVFCSLECFFLLKTATSTDIDADIISSTTHLVVFWRKYHLKLLNFSFKYKSTVIWDKSHISMRILWLIQLEPIYVALEIKKSN